MAELAKRDVFVLLMQWAALSFHEHEHQHDFLADPVPEDFPLLDDVFHLGAGASEQ